MELEEAKIYITNFTIKFAKDNFDKDIKVEFDYAIKRWGICYRHKNLISYSINFLEANKNNIQALEALAIHECCHLKIPNHSKQFKHLCSQHGVCENHTYKLPIAINYPQPKQYYLWQCPSCGIEFKKIKFSDKQQACRKCCTQYSNGKYDSKFMFKMIKYVDTELDKMKEVYAYGNESK